MVTHWNIDTSKTPSEPARWVIALLKVCPSSWPVDLGPLAIGPGTSINHITGLGLCCPGKCSTLCSQASFLHTPKYVQRNTFFKMLPGYSLVAKYSLW